MTDDIGLAYKIATLLWDENRRGSNGLTVLAMAMGIYLESQEGAHRDVKPLADVVCEQATVVFDLFQKKRMDA